MLRIDISEDKTAHKKDGDTHISGDKLKVIMLELGSLTSANLIKCLCFSPCGNICEKFFWY